MPTILASVISGAWPLLLAAAVLQKARRSGLGERGVRLRMRYPYREIDGAALAFCPRHHIPRHPDFTAPCAQRQAGRGEVVAGHDTLQHRRFAYQKVRRNFCCPPTWLQRVFPSRTPCHGIHRIV